MFYHIPLVTMWQRTVRRWWWLLGLFQRADLLMQLSIKEKSKICRAREQWNMECEEKFDVHLHLIFLEGSRHMRTDIITMQQNTVFSWWCVSGEFQWLECNRQYRPFGMAGQCIGRSCLDDPKRRLTWFFLQTSAVTFSFCEENFAISSCCSPVSLVDQNNEPCLIDSDNGIQRNGWILISPLRSFLTYLNMVLHLFHCQHMSYPGWTNFSPFEMVVLGMPSDWLNF